MHNLRLSFRRATRWIHLWLGLVGGLFICLLAVTGGIVSLRPQLAAWMSPASPVPAGCAGPYDWNRAEKQIRDFAHADLNRIYAPEGTDPRYHVRVMTDTPAIYQHVIYDVCAGKVLGSINYAWMDWLVDFHHNLLNGRNGRTAGGYVGLLLFLSSVGGFLLWLLSGAKIRRIFRLPQGPTSAVWNLDLHRTAGMTAGFLLLIGSFTSLWLCFPQTMRGMLNLVAQLPAEARAPRKKPDASNTKVPLGDVIAAAQGALPDASIREIRLPEGYGNTQVRMWRAGDFRSLGNNVVSVDPAGKVTQVDLYETKPGSNRFIQAMAGLHYGEWGGLPYRMIYAVSGFIAAALFASGIAIWWLTRRRAGASPRRVAEELAEPVTAV